MRRRRKDDNGTNRKAKKNTRDSSTIEDAIRGASNYTHTYPSTYACPNLYALALTPTDLAEKSVVPVVKSAMPILASRYATLTMVNGKLKMRAVNTQYGTFGVDADAECRSTRHLDYYYSARILGQDIQAPIPHEAPELNCVCGFYAFPTDKLHRFKDYSNHPLLLDVELSGKVIEHETGYRAEHQRVLGAKVGSCLCGNPAKEIWVSPPAEDKGFKLTMSCGEHKVLSVGFYMSLTLSQLSNALRVSVYSGEGESNG